MLPITLPLIPSLVCYTMIFVKVRRSHKNLKGFDEESKKNKGNNNPP